MVGLLDTQDYGGLISPDMQRQAAQRGLIGLMLGIGQASAPSLKPTSFAGALSTGGAAGLQAFDQAQDSALKRGLLGMQIGKLKQEAEVKRRQDQFISSLFGGAGLAGGEPSGGASPAGPTGGLLNDSTQNRLALMLGLGIQDPGKVYAAPTVRDMADGTGLKVPQQWTGAGGWKPIGGPEAPANYAFTPEGSLAPLAGGPQDPRVLESNAGASARGGMPYKPIALQEGGTAFFPSLFGSGTSVNPRQPAAPGRPAAAPFAATGPAMAGEPGIQVQRSPLGTSVTIPKPAMSKPTQGEIEKGMVADSDILSQITLIQQRFKPEFQTIGTKIGMEWSALKERVNPALLGAEQKAALGEFAQYRAEASQMFSNVLKSLSGAAVTPAEMKRAEGWLPNPGTGLFDGDSPTELKGKIERLQNFTQLALAKKSYIKERGLTVDAVDIDQMPRIMNNAGRQFEQQFVADGMSEDQARAAAARAVAVKFGLLAR